MTKTKRVLAMSLASAMALSMLAACSDGSSSDNVSQTDASQADGSGNEGSNVAPAETTRVINIGSWFDLYYTSAHDDVYDQTEVTDIETAQIQLDTIREVEKKYNIELYVKNLTWDGTISSINTSILAGTPDCDIYQVDLQFGVPAVLKGYAQAISSFADPDNDVLNDQIVVRSLNLEGQDEDYLFQDVSNETGSYFLAFNMDMIKAANLENPQDLYDKGEWTWAKWLEYLEALTQDTDGDGAIDQWGYSGWWTNLLTYMLMSNNTDIAATSEQHLDSARTVETIQFIEDMYKKGYAKPWSDTWAENVECYTTGQVAFWTSACWVADQYGDADESKISFEVGVVPWPRGYSVEEGEEYPGYAIAGNWFFIPKYINDADLVYQVFFDWKNWYNYDTELRDGNNWFAQTVYSPKADDPNRNFTYVSDMATRSYFDVWGSLEVVSLYDIITGTTTTAQYIEANKQVLQDAMDSFFK